MLVDYDFSRSTGRIKKGFDTQAAFAVAMNISHPAFFKLQKI